MREYVTKKLNRHTLIVVGSYALISILWIFLSDRLVAALFDTAMQTSAQTYKGLFFVILSSVFLFLIISTKNVSIRKLFTRSQNKMKIFQDTFEQAAVGIAHLSPDDEWIRVNKKLCNMLGYSKRKLKTLTLADIVHPDDLDKGKEEDSKLLSGESNSYVMKKRYITKKGELFHAKITKSVIKNGKSPKYLIAVIEDITEEQKATEKLKGSLQEKDLLVREIHHRVKNNLAIVSGLLELQANNTPDERVQKLLKDSMMRIKSMALIHESFYQSKKISHVAFENYLKDFVDYIRTALETSEKEITIKLNSEPVKLDINQAIPLGLLINELVINAYVHAFRDRAEGTIEISMNQNAEKITIKVKDNGIGVPPDFDLENSPTLGTTIIKTLCMQLKADINFETIDGTEFSLTFESKERSGSSSAVSAKDLI